MAHELVDRIRALDLLTADLEGDDWFVAANAARYEASKELIRLHDEMSERVEAQKNRSN